MLEDVEQDIIEERIAAIDLSVFDILLKDRTTGKNIVWGTTDYRFPSRRPFFRTKGCL